MDISVVVPLYNEAESLPELHKWIQRVMNANGFTYEIIFVNDGSCARSYRSLAGTGPRELVSDGVRMDVYNDHLDIWLRNFTTLEWENSPISVKLSRPPRPTE